MSERPFAGKVAIFDDAPNSPHVIALAGAGGVGQITLSPTIVSFVSQTVGTTSDAQTVTMTNGGTVPVRIGSVSVGGDFAQTNGC